MARQPDNISAGTQVVSWIEVRGPNNSLVHPRGAVAIITRTPAVPGGKLLVRFPDGFEASLARDQLEVLKHFKDRLGAPSSRSARADLEIGAPQDSPPDPAFDLEPFVIYRCVVGSRAYGLYLAPSAASRCPMSPPCGYGGSWPPDIPPTSTKSRLPSFHGPATTPFGVDRLPGPVLKAGRLAPTLGYQAERRRCSPGGGLHPAHLRMNWPTSAARGSIVT